MSLISPKSRNLVMIRRRRRERRKKEIKKGNKMTERRRRGGQGGGKMKKGKGNLNPLNSRNLVMIKGKERRKK